MSVIVPQVGEQNTLATLLNQSYRLHLYKNNYTPIAGSLLASFTECDFSGYLLQVVPAASWSVPGPDGLGRAVSIATALTFMVAAGGVANSVYGYYITDAGNTLLQWAERFTTAPQAMTNLGDSLTVTPQLTCKSEF